jgi:hypothetical protein
MDHCAPPNRGRNEVKIWANADGEERDTELQLCPLGRQKDRQKIWRRKGHRAAALSVRYTEGQTENLEKKGTQSFTFRPVSRQKDGQKIWRRKGYRAAALSVR